MAGKPLILYDKQVTPKVFAIQLHWDCPQTLVQFVLAQLPCGKQIILLSTDLSLSPSEVLEAYSWRCKIEVSFRTWVHLLGGFCYRFWLKATSRSPRWPQNLSLAEHSEAFVEKVERKVEAFERFVTLQGIALGILQVLSLERADSIWVLFPRWFRTLPTHDYPSEQIVRLTLQQYGARILTQSTPVLLLHKFLADKNRSSQGQYRQRLTS